jgi:hypothetical protein
MRPEGLNRIGAFASSVNSIWMISMKRLHILPSILASALALTAAHAQTPALVGSWKGTSTCVDPANHPNCHDEQVIYDATLRPGSKDSVNLRGYRVMNGAKDFMGEFDFIHAPDSSWVAELATPRFHLRVVLRIAGTQMKGSLIDLADNRQVRELVLQRMP